jgi:glycosyltransferase involved in cell wall biosynthesis
MRYGQNPLKMQNKPVKPPAPVTVGVLNCIPEQTGYFQGVFDSLKLCLASIREYADRPFDLLVVDNGSCPEVQAYLIAQLNAGRIDYLVLNQRNLGKFNAVMQLLHAAPGDQIFYTDGDIYFKPGWMQAHIEIADTFPDVAMVGGVPLRNHAENFTSTTLRWVEENQDQLAVEQGDLIPAEWSREFSQSIGWPPDKFMERWGGLQDCRITYRGVTAFVGASHMQYLTSRKAMEQVPHRRSEKALTSEDDEYIDRRLCDSGMLRLSTAQPYVYHLGNSLTSAPWLVDEYRRLVQEEPSDIERTVPQRDRHWFWGRGPVRTVLRTIHEWTFDKYYRYV